MQWTEGQQSAIDARNSSVLVSAAAGSGKTAVLVERVLSLLREGRRIDRMLIVTFTRAAAGEMRERIGRRLEKEGAYDAHLRRQALRLHRASICTLHVFCFKVLRENFQAANIDPLARIGDEDRLNTLRRRAQDEVLESAYGDPTEDEKILFAQFEDPQIVTLLDELYGFLMAQADPWGWAEAHTSDDQASMAAWMPLLRQLCRAQLDGAAELVPEMEKIMAQGGAPDRYVPAWEADQALMTQLLAESEDGTLRGGKTSFARLSTKKASPDEDPDAAARYKALREDWKERINDARELLPEDLDKAEKELRHTLPALRALCGLVRKMHDRYYALKQARNYLDYNDLEHLTLKVL